MFIKRNGMTRSMVHRHECVVAITMMLLVVGGLLPLPCHSITVLSQQAVATGLQFPCAAVLDASKTSVFIGECAGSAVLRVMATSPYTMTTYAGSRGSFGFVDGDATTVARFYGISGLLVWDLNRLYVGDRSNKAIRLVTATGGGHASTVSTVVNSMNVFSMTRYGKDALVFTEGLVAPYTIRMFTISNASLSTICGSPMYSCGLATDSKYIYAVSYNSGAIYRCTPGGGVTTLATIGGTHGGLAFLPAPSTSMLVTGAYGSVGYLYFAESSSTAASGQIAGSSQGEVFGIAPLTAATWFVLMYTQGTLVKMIVDLPHKDNSRSASLSTSMTISRSGEGSVSIRSASYPSTATRSPSSSASRFRSLSVSRSGRTTCASSSPMASKSFQTLSMTLSISTSVLPTPSISLSNPFSQSRESSSKSTSTSRSSVTETRSLSNVCNATTHCRMGGTVVIGGAYSSAVSIGSSGTSAAVLRSMLTDYSSSVPLHNFSVAVTILCGPADSSSPFSGVVVAPLNQNASWLRLQLGNDSRNDEEVSVAINHLRVGVAATSEPQSAVVAVATVTLIGDSSAAATLRSALSLSTFRYQPTLRLNVSVEVVCGGTSAAVVSLLIPVAPDVLPQAASTTASVINDVSSSFNLIAGLLSSGVGGAASLAALDLLQCGSSSLYPSIDDVVNGDSPMTFLISPWRRLGLTQAIIGNVLTMMVLYVVYGCAVIAAAVRLSPPSTLIGALRHRLTAVLFQWHTSLRDPAMASWVLLPCAKLRFPAMPLRVAAVLLPGTSLLSFGVAAQAASLGSVVTGIVGMFLIAATMVALFRVIVVYILPACHVHPVKHSQSQAGPLGPQLLSLASPCVEWMPVAVSQACSPMLNSAADVRAAQFLFVQILLLKAVVNGLAGLAAATTSDIACIGIAVMMGMLHAAEAVWCVVRRPFRSPIDAALVPLQSVLICVLCWMTAASLERPASLKLLQSLMAMCQVLLRLLVALLLERRAVVVPSNSKRENRHVLPEAAGEHGTLTECDEGMISGGVDDARLKAVPPPPPDELQLLSVATVLNPTALVAADEDLEDDEPVARQQRTHPTSMLLQEECDEPS